MISKRVSSFFRSSSNIMDSNILSVPYHSNNKRVSLLQELEDRCCYSDAVASSSNTGISPVTSVYLSISISPTDI